MTDQLTLDRDSNYKDYQKVIATTKKGGFEEALQICQKMLAEKVVFDDLFRIIKSLQFWINRKKKYYKKNDLAENQSITHLEKEWQEYKWNLMQYDFFQKDIFFALREAVYSEIIKNYFLLLEKKKNDNKSQKEIFLRVSQYLLKIKEVRDSYSLLNKSLELDKSYYNVERNLMFSNVFALQGKKEESILWLKKAFILRGKIDYKEIYLPSILESVAEMRQQNFLETEIEIWLPVYLYLSGFFYKFPLKLSYEELEESKLLEIVIEKEQSEWKKDNQSSSIIYCYLLLIEIFFYQKNNLQLKKYLYRLKKISKFIYQETKNHYI